MKCQFCGSINLGEIQTDIVSESDDPQYAEFKEIKYRDCLDCGELAAWVESDVKEGLK